MIRVAVDALTSPQGERAGHEAWLIGSEILSVFPKPGLANFQTLLSRFDDDTGPATRGMTSVVDHRTIRTVLTSVWADGARCAIYNC